MKYPFDSYETAESFIERIETNSNGHYPFGTSMFWHSGIHVYCESQKEFEPILDGKVVCYRISSDYKNVKIPVHLDKMELQGKWSDYKDFYDERTGKVMAEYKDQTYKISDSFMLLEHSIMINKKSFNFYTLYMNLAPKCDNPNYGDLVKADGLIHGHVINPNEKDFFIDKIGLPAKDKKDIYFDFVLLSDKSIKDFSSSSGQKLFWHISKNATFYQRIEQVQGTSQLITLPRRAYFTEKEYKNGNSVSYEITITSVNVYLPKDATDTNKKLKKISGITFADGNQKIFEPTEDLEFICNKVQSALNKLKESTVDVIEGTGFRYIKLKILPSITFWTKSSLKTKEKNVTDDQTVEKFYSNPYLIKYDMKSDISDEIKKNIKDISEKTYSASNGDSYYKVIFNNELSEDLFITEKDKNECFKYGTDFDNWFYFYPDSDSIYCDKTVLFEDTIKKHDNFVKKNRLIDEIIGVWWPAGKLTWDLLKYVYGKFSSEKNSLEGELTKPEIRKIVCRHPIEWDKNQFSNLDEKSIGSISKERLVNEATAIDLWNGGLDKIFPKKPYFYHPIYFINHMERAGVFEFNPYKGLSYKDLCKKGAKINEVYNRDNPAGNKSTNKCTLPTDWTVVDNPGFTTKPSNIENKFTEGNATGYGKVTGLFNEDYLPVTRFTKNKIEYPYSVYRNYYYHFGVDFSGKKGDPIIALIYGKVVAKCWISSNGRCLLIQGKTSNHLYMLCHLSSYGDKIQVGTEVYPGMVVAKVGTSGGASGSYSETTFKDSAHLHLSIIQSKANVKVADVLTAEKDISIKGGGMEKHRSWISPTYLDPFNYKYTGGWMQNKTDDSEQKRLELEENYRKQLQSKENEGAKK